MDSTNTAPMGIADWAHILENAAKTPLGHPDHALAQQAIPLAKAQLQSLVGTQNAADSTAAAAGPTTPQSFGMGAADAASMGLGPAISQSPGTFLTQAMGATQGLGVNPAAGPAIDQMLGLGGGGDFMKAATNAHPLAVGAGEIAGSIPTTALLTAKMAQMGLRSPALTAGLVNAIQGGVHGAVGAQITGHPATDAAIEAGLGGMVGAGGSVVLSRVGTVLGNLTKIFGRYGTDEQATQAAASIIGKRLGSTPATAGAEEMIGDQPISKVRTFLTKEYGPTKAEDLLARLRTAAQPPPEPPQVRTQGGGVNVSLPPRVAPPTPDPNDVQGFLRRVGIARTAETAAPMDATAARMSGVPAPPNVMGGTQATDQPSFEDFIRGKGAGGQPAGEAATAYRHGLSVAAAVERLEQQTGRSLTPDEINQVRQTLLGQAGSRPGKPLWYGGGTITRKP